MSSARTHARTRDIGQFGGQSEAGAEARDRLDEMRPPSHSSSNADDGPGTTTTTTTMTAMTVAGSGSTTSTGRKKERQGRPNKGERRKKETKKERKKEREKKRKKNCNIGSSLPPPTDIDTTSADSSQKGGRMEVRRFCPLQTGQSTGSAHGRGPRWCVRACVRCVRAVCVRTSTNDRAAMAGTCLPTWTEGQTEGRDWLDAMPITAARASLPRGRPSPNPPLSSSPPPKCCVLR